MLSLPTTRQWTNPLTKDKLYTNTTMFEMKLQQLNRCHDKLYENAEINSKAFKSKSSSELQADLQKVGEF